MTVEEVKKHVDIEYLTSRLEGNNSPLRNSEPDSQQRYNDTGLTKYVWRIARFISGEDDSMPIMCHYKLQDWLDNNNIDANVSGITDDAGKEIIDYLWDVADEVLDNLGISNRNGLERWKRLV